MLVTQLDGEYVHGELSSADVSTAAAVTLYTSKAPAGATTKPTRTLATGERLIVTDIRIISGSAITVTMFDDWNADGLVNNGERMAQGNFAANGGEVAVNASPYPMKPGDVPKVKASAAGQVDVIILGIIVAS